MTDINTDDEYLHRLGKLVPVYVVSMVIAVEGFFNFFKEDLTRFAAIVAVAVAAIVLIYLIEIRNQKVSRKDQIIVFIVSSILYISLLTLRIYTAPDELNMLGSLIALLWTFIAPAMIK